MTKSVRLNEDMRRQILIAALAHGFNKKREALQGRLESLIEEYAPVVQAHRSKKTVQQAKADIKAAKRLIDLGICASPSFDYIDKVRVNGRSYGFGRLRFNTIIPPIGKMFDLDVSVVSEEYASLFDKLQADTEVFFATRSSAEASLFGLLRKTTTLNAIKKDMPELWSVVPTYLKSKLTAAHQTPADISKLITTLDLPKVPPTDEPKVIEA